MCEGLSASDASQSLGVREVVQVGPANLWGLGDRYQLLGLQPPARRQRSPQSRCWHRLADQTGKRGPRPRACGNTPLSQQGPGLRAQFEGAGRWLVLKGPASSGNSQGSSKPGLLGWCFAARVHYCVVGHLYSVLRTGRLKALKGTKTEKQEHTAPGTFRTLHTYRD